MNRVATVTVIRGNGGVEAFMNNIVNEEIKRQRELEHKELEKERDYANMIKNKRNELLREKRDELRAQSCPRCNKRIRNKVRETFEFVLGCLICWGEQLGFIEYVYDDEKKKGDWKRK